MEEKRILKKITFLGDYICQKFVTSTKPDGQYADISPGDLSDQITVVNYKLEHIDLACVEAKKAYLPWAKLSLDERKKYLLKLKEIFVAHESEMAEAIARDTGKALWDALTEAKALAAKIDITLNESLKLVSEQRIANALPQVEGVLRYKSRGVMAVVGPFNFPAHLPNGHIIPALITGNTIVYKPSEQRLRQIEKQMPEIEAEIDFQKMRTSKDLKKINYKLFRCPNYSTENPTFLLLHPGFTNPYALIIDEFVLLFSFRNNYNDFLDKDLFNPLVMIQDAGLTIPKHLKKLRRSVKKLRSESDNPANSEAS